MEANSLLDMTNPTVHKLMFDFRTLDEILGADHDNPFCAELVESSFPDYAEGWLQLIDGLKIVIPETAQWEYYDFMVDGLDFIHTNKPFPIMSKRMIEVLESVKPFEYIAHPIKLRQTKPAPDGTGVGLEREFYILNVIGQLDIFDWENSEYTRNSIGRIGDLEKAVFHEPPGGLPPFFIEKNMRSLRLVSDEAKQALEAAGIKGPRFWPPTLP